MGDFAANVIGIGALADPVRRDLYRYVCGQPSPVSREEAATALDLPPHQVKFHLDRLVRDGLLETGQARLTGRRGPGAGRPAKVYRRVGQEIAVSLPERSYALAGDLLADAVSEAAASGRPVLDAVTATATERGHAIGRDCVAPATRRSERQARETVLTTLEAQGYEPRADGGRVVMANCPFHALAQTHTDLVCGMNLALLDGLVSEVGGYRARLDPAEGRCCVVLEPVRR